MASSVPPAAHYRAHAQVFTLALELGVTPKEAEAVLAQRAARDRWEESARRLAAKAVPQDANGGRFVLPPRRDEYDQGAPWMMRD